MRVVHKFQIMPDHVTEVLVSTDHKVVLFGVQNRRFFVWIETRTGQRVEDMIRRPFKVIGTGMIVPDGWAHCGSVQDGPFVWHLYGP